MRAKELLNSITNMQKQINNKREKIVLLREMATSTSPNLSGMPHAPRSCTSPMANTVCKIADLEQEIKDLEKTRQQAIDVLSGIEDVELYTVLIKRYVQDKAWIDVAIEMYYGRSKVFNLHRAAIDALDKVLEKMDYSWTTRGLAVDS